MTSTCIAVFARAIEPGKVKTRLAATLGDAAALDVYCQMLERTLQAVQATGLAASLWATDSRCQALQSLARKYGCSLHQQDGAGLGARMLHTLRVMHRYHERVVLVGSDCVLLDRDRLLGVAAQLEYSQCVICPAEDGGFVLIGSQRAVDWQITDLDGVRWSSAETLADTLRCLKQKEVRATILDSLWDVDTVDDLRRAVAEGRLDARDWL
jgi:hypothetical protein